MPGSQQRVDAASRRARELPTISVEATSVLREEAWRISDEEKLSLAPLSKRLGASRTRASEFLHARPDEPAGPDEPSTKPEPVPVVVAIVSSHLGVLTGRRQDGKPPLGFISGKIEPGESPADAAIREVKEETGLVIKTGRILGSRLHPQTNRFLTYVAAWPASADTGIAVLDEDELSAVQWMSFTEVTDVMDRTCSSRWEAPQADTGGLMLEPMTAWVRSGPSPPTRRPVAAQRRRPWLDGPVMADNSEHFMVESLLREHGINPDGLLWVHSTSWDPDGPRHVDTYLAVVNLGAGLRARRGRTPRR